jgi:hypothetical protein
MIQMAMTDGWRGFGHSSSAEEDSLMGDRKFLQIRARIEDLEERLMRRIASSGKQVKQGSLPGSSGQ